MRVLYPQDPLVLKHFKAKPITILKSSPTSQVNFCSRFMLTKSVKITYLSDTSLSVMEQTYCTTEK